MRTRLAPRSMEFVSQLFRSCTQYVAIALTNLVMLIHTKVNVVHCSTATASPRSCLGLDRNDLGGMLSCRKHGLLWNALHWFIQERKCQNTRCRAIPQLPPPTIQPICYKDCSSLACVSGQA
ncbi:hypothetical protein GOODEAATRI_023403 [Goodea atripinnis]|uniref:Secreted protein n=1 Tax=Goodea atripinnis TaxID=208336 RepID=A0ABV0N3S8_9TELE